MSVTISNPSDAVRSPKHYTGALAEKLGIEVIDVANALNLNGNRFSILRYVCRAGLKDPSKEIEDLEKIIEYAQFEIRRLQGEPVSNTRRRMTVSVNDSKIYAGTISAEAGAMK